MRRVAIIGVGYTKIGRHWGKALRDLFAEAFINAMDDVGWPNVDMVYIGNMASGLFCEQENLAALLTEVVSLNPTPAVKVEAACGSGGAALAQGFMAVASGLYDTVVVAGVEKMTEVVTRDATKILATAADREYEVFQGASFTALNALIMRLYMNKFSAPEEAFGAFAVQMHENALDCPYAQLRFKISISDYLNSTLIADPIKLLDCAPIGDGAACLVLCPLEKARELCDTPVEIAGVGLATDTLNVSTREDLLTLKATVYATRKAFKMAKVELKDVSFLEVHDAFTIMGILALEDMGFTRKGEGWKLAQEGQLARDGDIPVNPEGGLKARGHPVGATGIYQAVEAVLQLRGEAEKRQIEKAEVAALQNVGGAGGFVSVHVLRRV